MSMVVCDCCNGFIDSDVDCDCFIEVPWLNLAARVWCESCRESEQEKHDGRESRYVI